MKKKCIMIAIALMMLITACACGPDNKNSGTPSVSGSSSGTTVSQTSPLSTGTRSGTAQQTGLSPAPNDEKTALTKQELDWFTEYFNQFKNNGFLLSGYADPSGIDLKQLFYGGAEISTSKFDSEDEKQAYLSAAGKETLEFDLIKITTAQADAFLKEKMGITLADVKGKMSGVYLPKYDAYYHEVSDTNFTIIKCTDGYKTAGGNYIINCTGSGVIEKCTVTMKSTDGGKYLFVSNKIN